MEEEYFTVDEVAKRFKVTRKTVYDWMREGQLRYVLVGERRRIARSALVEFVRPGMPGDEAENAQKNLEPALAF